MTSDVICVESDVKS